MACGVPVVAAKLGQLSEVVRDGTTGAVYPAGDLDALVSACEAVLADPVAARRMGDAGVAAVAARHTWAHNAAQVTRIAEALAADRMAHA
jgi:glycosyltransferase involved in cell wall biosynthesis